MTYKVQIDNVVREATTNEIAQIEANHEANRIHGAVIEAAAAAKISGRAKLAALGLTDAEITALLGA